LLDPIDFAAAYMSQVEAAQTQVSGDGNGGSEQAPSEV
jgi:hypothetical protein